MNLGLSALFLPIINQVANVDFGQLSVTFLGWIRTNKMKLNLNKRPVLPEFGN